MPRVSHSLVQTLRAIPGFSDLDEEILLQIVGESMNLFWQEDSKVFEAGQPGRALFVVLSGEISIRDGEGNETMRSKAGSYFGEIALLRNTVRTETAVAVTDTELLVVPKENFEWLLKENPELAAHFKASHPGDDQSSISSQR